MKFSNTPVYHVFTEQYNWTLPFEEDGDIVSYCRIYGDFALLAFRVCAIDVFDPRLNGSTTVLGTFLLLSFISLTAFATCETNSLVIQPGLDCSNPEKWAGQQSVRIRSQKRYADITYELPRGIRNIVAPVSGIVDSTYVPAESYLTFCDTILPAGRPDVKGLDIMLLTRCSTATLSGSLDWLYLISTLPWRVQLPSPVLKYYTLSKDDIIQASTCITIARI
jgi:hypothetical protein